MTIGSQSYFFLQKEAGNAKKLAVRHSVDLYGIAYGGG